MKETVKRLKKFKGQIGEVVDAKVTNVSEKSPGQAQMKAIKNIHTSLSSEVFIKFDINFSPSDMISTKFFLITSVNVE